MSPTKYRRAEALFDPSRSHARGELIEARCQDRMLPIVWRFQAIAPRQRPSAPPPIATKAAAAPSISARDAFAPMPSEATAEPSPSLHAHIDSVAAAGEGGSSAASGPGCI